MLRSTLMSCSLVLALSGVVSAGDAPATEEIPSSPRPPAVLAAEIWAITDAVLDHHIDPPTRQQMILDALHAVHTRADQVLLAEGLARRVSELTGPESLIPLLEEAWSRRERPNEAVLLDGLLVNVSGQARRGLTREFAVEEQLTGNLYVGLQITLSFDKESGRPRVDSVMSGGPAERAHMRRGDLIEEIDGAATEGMGPLQNVVARLRGPLGSRVVLKLRQPRSQDVRVLTITRGLLPRKSVEGIRSTTDGEGDLLLQGPGPIGYVKLLEISGSTPRELRSAVRRLEEQGAKALVLDLRPALSASLHPAVLLADELLEAGTIGQVRTSGRVETFHAEADALLRDAPLAVLVDHQTFGPTALLAAALQDNHRAPLVASGRRRNEQGGVSSVIPVGDGTWSIKLTTGRLERGDGRALALLPDIVASVPTRAGSEIDPQVRDDAVLSAGVDYLRRMLELP